jgi:hypothetical protein
LFVVIPAAVRESAAAPGCAHHSTSRAFVTDRATLHRDRYGGLSTLAGELVASGRVGAGFFVDVAGSDISSYVGKALGKSSTLGGAWAPGRFS